MKSQPEYLTVEDLAVMFHMTTRAARLVLERGELPGFKVGRRWFIRPEILDAHIRAMEANHLRDRERAARLLRGLRDRDAAGPWPEAAAEGP